MLRLALFYKPIDVNKGYLDGLGRCVSYSPRCHQSLCVLALETSDYRANFDGCPGSPLRQKGWGSARYQLRHFTTVSVHGTYCLIALDGDWEAVQRFLSGCCDHNFLNQCRGSLTCGQKI